MDSKLEFLMKRHGVHVRLDQPIQRPAYLTKLPTHYELAVRAGLEGPELDEAVAFQLARLLLGQLERLDKDGDTKLAEWRQAVFLAARMLVPDELAARADGDIARAVAPLAVEAVDATQLLGRDAPGPGLQIARQRI
ncbi:MAG: hypothetical protein ACK46X_16605, partial [Candidatus Sericytochromatia bacterium]